MPAAAAAQPPGGARAASARFLAAVLLLASSACSCEADDPVEQRVSGDKLSAGGQADRGIHRYLVAAPVIVCPDPADFRHRIDRLLEGEPDFEPPPSCRSLPAGALLLMENQGYRSSVAYRGFPIERATLPDGTAIWSDEFGATNLRPLDAAADH